MNYTDLDIWLETRKLVKEIYLLTINFPKEEVFGLSSQIRRCAVSIPSNIAEGCGRNTPRGTLAFLYISRGSIFELETQLYLACDLDYISQQTFDRVIIDIQNCKKLLNGFINYYKKIDNDNKR